MLHKSIKIFFGFILFLISPKQIQAQQVDTVSNYFQLNIYSGDKDSVYVDHPRYYGLFIKDTCSYEDFGTRIQTSDACWKRDYQNFLPRYWALNSASPDNIIGTVYEEIDAINSAAVAAHLAGGDTIEIDRMYEIDRSVFLISGNTYLGVGDSCGFRRINTPKTILTDTAFAGDNKIFVQNNTGFRTRQKINITNGIAYDSLAGFVSYTASVSIPLGGDTTIFLSGLSMQKTMFPVDSVSLFFPIMLPRFSDLDSVYLKNLVLDGNRSSYNLNFDWRVGTSIMLPTTTESIIEDCRFYNIPNENIFLCGAVFKNCSGTNFNGSVLHFSCNTFERPTEVLYNDFSNINEVGNETMVHSEAALTFSAKVQNLLVAYNRFRNTHEFGIGIFRNDDRSNEITDNLLESDLETIAFDAFYTMEDSNLIYNNKNPFYTDTSDSSCFIQPPTLIDSFQCIGSSSLQNPLTLGDTIRIYLDSFQVRNSNENFLKCIQAIYDDRFFSLTNMEISHSLLSERHHWIFDQSSGVCSGLVFDNGHQSGTGGVGNWGYEGCGQPGNCRDIQLDFIVTDLPDSTREVSCPLKGLEFKYDGEIDTWEYLPICQNSPIVFDSLQLGKPYLEGNPLTTQSPSLIEKLTVYPNPVTERLFIDKVSIESGVINFRIMNTAGQTQKSGRFITNELNVKELPAGLYILVLEKEQSLFYARFVKS